MSLVLFALFLPLYCLLDSFARPVLPYQYIVLAWWWQSEEKNQKNEMNGWMMALNNSL